MINNKEFNEWLEKYKGIKHGDLGWWQGTGMVMVYVKNDWLIGLMTQWLLDKGFTIDKQFTDYCIIDGFEQVSVRSESLYDCLVSAIEVIGNIHKEKL